MEIARKKVRMQSPLVNPIIDLERPLETVLKKGEYIAIKYHNTPGDNDSGSMRSTSPIMEDDHLKSGLSGKTNFARP